jgi:predicted RNA-binding Zn-ribbon protein involved in translation (DUF1610 family)
MTSIEKSTDAVEAGSFVCSTCSLPIALDHSGELPECPNCGATDFKRASIFAEQPTISAPSLAEQAHADSDWLGEARESIEAPGKYLAAFVDGRVRVFKLHDGWSRIGRASSADIRLDDPTVSRRHAVIVCTPEGAGAGPSPNRPS